MRLGYFFRLFIFILLTFLLTSCLVGPNFHRPPLPQTCSYTPLPIPCKTTSTPTMGEAGQPQYFIAGRDIPGDWWRVFHSPELNCLIMAGLIKSPNLRAAEAALLEAQYNYIAQVGNLLLPAVNAGFTAQRQRFNGTSLGIPTEAIFNLFNASVNVTYTLDVFGGSRRQLEGLCAQAHYEWYQMQATYLTLTANIVTTSITIASLREQIKATYDLIRAQENELVILEKQFRLGGISQIDVLTQRTLVFQTRATLPILQQRLAQNNHALSVLIGELPCSDQLPKFDLKKLNLPNCLPTSIPSLLVRQRPDVLSAEALLHVASAQIGVATANLFPQFNLSGNGGWQGLVLGTLFDPANKVWNITNAITTPLFHGGALFAQRCAAIAAYNQALDQYQQVVLQAFQNVADSLRALENDAYGLQYQREAELAAKKSLDLITSQFRLGGASYVSLLIAERNYHQSRINRIIVEGQRYNDTAALFQSLGGGWWNRRSCGC